MRADPPRRGPLTFLARSAAPNVLMGCHSAA